VVRSGGGGRVGREEYEGAYGGPTDAVSVIVRQGCNNCALSCLEAFLHIRSRGNSTLPEDERRYGRVALWRQHNQLTNRLQLNIHHTPLPCIAYMLCLVLAKEPKWQ